MNISALISFITSNKLAVSLGFCGVIVFVLSCRINVLTSHNEELEENNVSLQTQLNTSMRQIRQLESAQLAVADIDKKRTQELNDALKKINALEYAVNAHAMQLFVKADCATMPVSSTATTTGVVNGSKPRLTDAAKQDYFLLRKRIEIADKQIKGLQDYINKACLHF